MAKTRNKITHYDKDLHIRIHGDYLELLRKEAEEKGVTNALMARMIIEEYFKKKEEHRQEDSVSINWVGTPITINRENISFPNAFVTHSHLATGTSQAEDIATRLQREHFDYVHRDAQRGFATTRFDRNIFDENTVNRNLFR